ncbi:glycerophosphodiester phosphodiesterase family protein [Acinetobacter rathckeae]|uniref:glycerophosphodiester phosphodiesterase family protein n=1 Tax=Acinetobacter rathckeae TaxID=2605272 RepID=UPI0018A3083C|nr:glycerophosphodiester phosphodiesterase family protein [Acinetobacter rathckeae]MBF7695366.1 glycerophosphodiester phosphodiesterase [Acinetobacter rathckeae]
MIKKACLYGLVCFFSAVALADPFVVAHRGGTADAPENTVSAIQKALTNHANIVWVTVQMSKDGMVVLYRPSNLSSLSNGDGLVSAYDYAELEKLNVARDFNQKHHSHFDEKMPTLQQVLERFPHTPFVIDIKSPDADPQYMAKQLTDLVMAQHAEKRVVFYSTNTAFLTALPKHLNRFESRDDTRMLLTHILLSGGQCPIDKKLNQRKWYGFELRRKVEVVEKFTLGEGRTATELVWNKAAMDCLRTGGSSVVLFAINSPADYQLAKKLHADAVMVDSLVDLNQTFKH